LFASSVATAQEDAWNLEALMQMLSGRTYAEASFVERKYLKVLETPLQTSGRLMYIAPDRLEKLTLKPKRELLLVNGDTVTIERAGDSHPRTLRLQTHPALWGFIDSIRGTLAGDLEALQRLYAIDLNGSEQNWEMVLTPRVQMMRSVVKQIAIRGSEARIRSIEITEARGDRSIMQVDEAGS
jgi:hypothetical protein